MIICDFLFMFYLEVLPLTLPCLEFAPRSQSFAKATWSQFASSARYPDSLALRPFANSLSPLGRGVDSVINLAS